MPRIVRALFFVMFCLAEIPAGASSPTGRSGGLPSVVSTSWLADHLRDPSLVILQVSSHRRQYLEGHIPGARFLWPDWLVSDNPDLSYELPSVSELTQRLEDLGVSDSSEIVLCFSGSELSSTTRMFFTLDYLGLADRAYILDGGLNAWKAEKRPLTTDTAAHAEGTVAPRVREEVRTNGDWIAGHLHDRGIRLVDARASVFYTGENPTWDKKGHIPGAVNVPFNTVADSVSKFKSADTLQAIFDRAGIKRGDKIVPYCHVGQQATVIYFVAKNLGYDVSLYDGAFEDWAGRQNAPVEAAAAALLKPAKGEKIVYVCPMDKDVVSSRPGNCPKCGMTLVAKVVPLKDPKARRR